MKIWKIHSFLTYPAKALDDKPPIRGAEVTSGTRLYGMLEEVFEKSSHECNIEISFNSESGSPTNASRSIIVNYVKKPTIPKGRKIAKQLQSVTTHRSGMGLLFLVLARSRKKSALLVSRFPADVGVLAEEAGKDLSVEFVEKVFMKNAKSYKAALYEGKSIDSGFWDGRATDKQILKRDETLSEYWIRDFLQSDLYCVLWNNFCYFSRHGRRNNQLVLC